MSRLRDYDNLFIKTFPSYFNKIFLFAYSIAVPTKKAPHIIDIQEVTKEKKATYLLFLIVFYQIDLKRVR